MKQPKVSINLTTYNRAHLLPRAIKSVLNQTFKNWELVIVDDGSSDDTKKLLKKYKETDQRIRPVFHSRNQGNAAARNTALNHSSGEYIAFLDDDDQWADKNKLEKQLRAWQESTDPRLGIVCTGVNLVRVNQTISKKPTHPPNIRSHILKGNGIIYSPTVMTKRSILTAVGGFDPKMKRGVDSEFYRTCIIRHNLSVVFLKSITTNVYEHTDKRLTPTSGFQGVKDSLSANLYLLFKYIPEYLIYPASAMVRLKTIIVNLFQFATIALK